MRVRDTLRTPRCELVRLAPADRVHVMRLRHDTAVRRFLGGPASRVDFEAVLAEGPWAVHCGGEFVGLITVNAHHDSPYPQISYEFLPEHWGRGLATESVGAVLTHALEAHTHIVAETQVANLASRRLLERLGLRVERQLLRFDEPQLLYTTAGQNPSTPR